MDSGFVKKRLDMALSWLENSGIVRNDGGVYCWYDMENDSYPFIYPEITAYYISTQLYLNQLEKAKVFGEWLVQNGQYKGRDQKAKGGFYWKVFPEKRKSKFVYTFDTGMCINALVELYRKTKNQKFLDSALLAGDWLVEKMQQPNGSFQPCYNLTLKDRYRIDDKWSRHPGIFHSKLSISLLKLYGLTGEGKYKESAVKLCHWAHLQDIFTDKKVYVHALCYGAEGMLYHANYFNDREYLTHAVWLASKIADTQGLDGGVGRWCYLNGCEDQNTEATAQAVRLWIILSHMFPKDEFFVENIESGLNYLFGKQCLKDNPRTKGGMFYAVLEGKLVPHINTCATLFFIQTLQMYLDWKNKKLSRPLRWLV